MSEQLKPCPFCGSEPHDAHHIEYGRWAVTCNCGVMGACANAGPNASDAAKIKAYNDARHAWNTRALTTSHPAQAGEDRACGVMSLIEDYAKAVHDGNDALCQVLFRTIEASLRTQPAQPAAEFAWPEPEPAAEADVLAGIAEVERLMGQPAAEVCRQLVAPNIAKQAASDGQFFAFILEVMAEGQALMTKQGNKHQAAKFKEGLNKAAERRLNQLKAILALRPQPEPIAFAWREKGSTKPWQVCFDVSQARDADVLARTEIRYMAWADADLRPQAVPMTDEQIEPMFCARKAMPAEGEKDAWYWYAWGVNDGEAHHGITAQGAQGEPK